MSEPRSHEELIDLLAVYALDAVDDDERAAVEEHLRVCPRCRAELADHREVTALLAHTGAPAPEQVWDRIARSLEEAPPAVPLGQVLALEDRRAARRANRALLVLGAAAVLVVAVLSFAVFRQSQDIDELKTNGIEQAAKAALEDPGSQLVELASEDDRVHASVVIASDGRGFVYEDTLPALSADETWQLWGVEGDEAISLGILGPDPDTVSFRVEGDVELLAVTREQAGGVITSEEPATVAGQVS